MMKKRMMILVVCMAMMLTACGSDQADTKQDEKPQADIVIDKPDLGHVDEAETEEKDNADDDREDEADTEEKEDTDADRLDEDDTEEKEDTDADTIAEEDIEQEDIDSTEEESGDDESYPGPDVAYLVNLRGDESTVYKLVDGTYMDRINRRFTYNGTDTWTDEDGVEWNEKVN